MSEENPTHRKPADLSWENWIDRLIREAQERGEFDNLRGHGRPLVERQRAFVPEDTQMAYDLIQESGHTLPWIGDRQEIDRRTEAARLQLQRDYARYLADHREAAPAAQIAVAQAWEHDQQVFAREIAAINRLIDDYNLKAPSVQLHKFRLLLTEELARLTPAP